MNREQYIAYLASEGVDVYAGTVEKPTRPSVAGERWPDECFWLRARFEADQLGPYGDLDTALADARTFRPNLEQEYTP